MMEARELGKSGLSVTPLGLGLAALGRPGYINLGHSADLGDLRDVETMEQRAHEVLDAAYAAGVRYFDAARSYGRAEAFLGSWLRQRRSAGVTIGSKWGYTYTAGWQVDAEKHEVKEHSLEVLHRQIEESRRQLGEALHLYQIHSATLESGVLANEPVLNRLADLKAEGLRIGLSVSGPRQDEVIRRALEIGLFDCVQATWNLLEQSAGAALAEAHRAGLGVIIKEALANGRLTNRNDDPALRLLRDRDAPVDQLALAAALRQPWASVVLSGAATVGHLTSNVASVSVECPDELFSLAESPDQYWTTRSSLNWN